MSDTIETTDLTAAADEAAIEKANHLAESAASDLYSLFDEDKSTYTRAKRIQRWVDKGADVKLIAGHLSRQRADRLFSDEPEDVRLELAEAAPSKGGVRVADTTIRAYVNAWGAVYDAGLAPSEDTVAWAFKVKSKGRTSQPLKRLIETIKAQVEAEEVNPVEGSALFVTGAKAILAGRVEADPAKPRKRSESEGEEQELAEDVPMSVEVAIHNLKVILGQPWSDDEFAVIAASVEELLSTRTVEV